MIGRENEIRELRRTFASNESEFVAIYGRRRIGKTFLVNEVFNGNFAFHHAGMEKADKQTQLESFRNALRRQGLAKCKVLHSWIQAFSALSDLLESKGSGKKVVFLDELPWFDTPRSGFLPAFEQFWNSWACLRKDILLIICGSATSWIIRKVLRNRGGLHNRVTRQLPVRQFTLAECAQYTDYKRLGFDKQQILECYMAFGGVAYYWSLLEEGKSAAQNFDSLFFDESADLRMEFENVFRSLFKNPTRHFAIINLFGEKKTGLTREEVIEGLGETSSGDVSECLEELCDCGFLRRYNTYGVFKKGAVYQLIDNFTLFHFSFLRNRAGNDGRYWSLSFNQPKTNSWRGLAFERVCMLHIDQIKRALGISGVLADVYSWRNRAKKDGERGAQIDMVIDRGDRMINVCEMKYAHGDYSFSIDEKTKLLHRIEQFRLATHTRKGILPTLVTTYGLTRNANGAMITNVITLDDLF
jgi:hypothetical protein